MDADRIRPVVEKIVADLKTKVGNKGSQKWQFRKMEVVKTPSGNPVEKLVKYELTATEIITAMENKFIAAACDLENTTPFDNLFFKVFKPTFPHKDWLHASIEALDALNVTAVGGNNGEEIPDGIFTEAELAAYEKQARYACGDSGRFSGMISNHWDYYFMNQVLNRAYRAEADSKRAAKAKAAQDASPGDLSKLSAANYVNSAKSVCTATNDGRSGICTTFAWAAAAPLMERMQKRQIKSGESDEALERIEVVAFTNHIFCVVNREGDALELNEALPRPDTWNDDVLQLDIWLGTLGWPYIYVGTGGANAKMGFLEPLKSLFDSKKAGWT